MQRLSAVDAEIEGIDPRLKGVIARWSALPENVRRIILAIVEQEGPAKPHP
jgi:hypothetical protein